MTREELAAFLKADTEQEKQILNRRRKEECGERAAKAGASREESAALREEPASFREESALFQKEDTPFRQDIPAFCLDDQELLRTGDSIGIVRQGRYDPVGRHTHTYLELAYVWSGESVQWIEGERLPMRRGDICLMDPEVEHAVEACGREDTVVNLVMPQRLFDYTFLSKMGEQSILSRFLLNAVTKQRNRKHYLYFPTSGNERAAWLMETLLLEYYERDLGWREAMDSYLLLLFTEMLRSFRAGGGQEESGTGASVQEILAYIETNYRDCTLSQAAAQFSFHPVYLTTMLKEKTGRGFLEHLQSQRLHMACYLLLHTDMKIAEIAEEVGYSNLDFFYRKFKAAQGCTPRAFRELSK